MLVIVCACSIFFYRINAPKKDGLGGVGLTNTTGWRVGPVPFGGADELTGSIELMALGTLEKTLRSKAEVSMWVRAVH